MTTDELAAELAQCPPGTPVVIQSLTPEYESVKFEEIIGTRYDGSMLVLECYEETS